MSEKWVKKEWKVSEEMSEKWVKKWVKNECSHDKINEWTNIKQPFTHFSLTFSEKWVKNEWMAVLCLFIRVYFNERNQRINSPFKKNCSFHPNRRPRLLVLLIFPRCHLEFACSDPKHENTIIWEILTIKTLKMYQTCILSFRTPTRKKSRLNIIHKSSSMHSKKSRLNIIHSSSMHSQ